MLGGWRHGARRGRPGWAWERPGSRLPSLLGPALPSFLAPAHRPGLSVCVRICLEHLLGSGVALGRRQPGAGLRQERPGSHREEATRSADHRAGGAGGGRPELSAQRGPGAPCRAQDAGWLPATLGRAGEGRAARGVPDSVPPPASLSQVTGLPCASESRPPPLAFRRPQRLPVVSGTQLRTDARVPLGEAEDLARARLPCPFPRGARPSPSEPNDESGANVDASKMWRDDREQFCRVARQLAQKSLGL